MGYTRIQWITAAWIFFMVASALALLFLSLNPSYQIADRYHSAFVLYAVIAVVAFFCEYMDSSIGMGYGTILTPVLLILGFSPLQVVPCLLLSEMLSGTFAGITHHQLGNVDLLRGRSRNTMIILSVCSLLGAIVAVIAAVNLSKFAVKLYIGVMITAIGLLLILGRNMFGQYSQKKIVGLGVWAAFNKGISGGGYGPLITGGQVLLGVPEKQAIGITSFAEGLVCMVGLTLYLIIQKGALDWHLAGPLIIGALVSVPLAAWTVKILPSQVLRRTIGAMTLYLGALCIINLIMDVVRSQ